MSHRLGLVFPSTDFRLIHGSVGCLVLQSAYSEVNQGINPPCDMVSSSTVSISTVPSITDTYIIDSIASNVEKGPIDINHYPWFYLLMD